MPFVITPGELEFEHGLILSGQSFKVFAATKGSLTSASTISAWEAVELASTGGYASVTGTVAAGSLNSTTGRWESPVISGTFGPATGAGFQYDAVIIKIGSSRTKPYAVNLLASPIVLAAGQSRGFQYTLGIKP
jgi:hypothetical protein